MKDFGELLIQSLEDADAFADGKLDARIQIREVPMREPKSTEVTEDIAPEDLYLCRLRD